MQIPADSQEWLDNKITIRSRHKEAINTINALEKQIRDLQEEAGILYRLLGKEPIRILDREGKIDSNTSRPVLTYHVKTTAKRIYYAYIDRSGEYFADRWTGECGYGSKIHPDDLLKFSAITK